MRIFINLGLDCDGGLDIGNKDGSDLSRTIADDDNCCLSASRHANNVHKDW